MRHSQTFYNTTAANANEQTMAPVFKESSKRLTVHRVFCNVATAGVILRIHVGTQQIASIDCAIFAAGNGPVHVDFELNPQDPWDFSIQDLAGAAHTNIAVYFEYETTQ